MQVTSMQKVSCDASTGSRGRTAQADTGTETDTHDLFVCKCQQKCDISLSPFWLLASQAEQEKVLGMQRLSGALNSPKTATIFEKWKRYGNGGSVHGVIGQGIRKQQPKHGAIAGHTSWAVPPMDEGSVYLGSTDDAMRERERERDQRGAAHAHMQRASQAQPLQMAGAQQGAAEQPGAPMLTHLHPGINGLTAPGATGPMAQGVDAPGAHGSGYMQQVDTAGAAGFHAGGAGVAGGSNGNACAPAYGMSPLSMGMGDAAYASGVDMGSHPGTIIQPEKCGLACGETG